MFLHRFPIKTRRKAIRKFLKRNHPRKFETYCRQTSQRRRQLLTETVEDLLELIRTT